MYNYTKKVKDCHHGCKYVYYDGLYSTYCNHPEIKRYICGPDNECNTANCEYYEEKEEDDVDAFVD